MLCDDWLTLICKKKRWWFAALDRRVWEDMEEVVGRSFCIFNNDDIEAVDCCAVPTGAYTFTYL